MPPYGVPSAAASSAYRAADVMSASPQQLVVLSYDQTLAAYRRARIAMESNDIEGIGVHLDRARAFLLELRCGLSDQGDATVVAMAQHLAGLYTFWINEIGALIVRPNVSTLDRLAAMATELRDAFATALAAVQGAEPADPAPTSPVGGHIRLG